MLFLYIKERIRVIAAFIVFSGIFAVVFSLYHLNILAVAYPALLCTAILVIYGIFDFSAFRKKRIIFRNTEPDAEVVLRELSRYKRADDMMYQDIISGIDILSRKKSEKDAARYNEMINYYTAWAHQIKTPIAAMRLTLGGLDSNESRLLSAELTEIEQYVEMVLCYLRLGSESTDYVVKEHELDDIIRPAIRKFSSQFIGKGIALKYEPLNTVVVTDDKWLLFVFEQIISNAVKYTHEGEISIYMRGKELVVEDTGIGIASEDVNRIFEKGFTGYNGREDKKATGIGLYLCKRICGNLNHPVYAESEVGKGTKIIIGFSQKRRLFE